MSSLAVVVFLLVLVLLAWALWPFRRRLLQLLGAPTGKTGESGDGSLPRSFSDQWEFRAHRDSLRPPDWEEVPVEDPVEVGGLDEHWYREVRTGEVWRLVTPDAPFRGTWER